VLPEPVPEEPVDEEPVVPAWLEPPEGAVGVVELPEDGLLAPLAPLEPWPVPGSDVLPVGPDDPAVVVCPVAAVLPVAPLAKALLATWPPTPAASRQPLASAQSMARALRRVILLRGGMRADRSSGDRPMWGS
jgi:hypothetical protein